MLDFDREKKTLQQWKYIVLWESNTCKEQGQLRGVPFISYGIQKIL